MNQKLLKRCGSGVAHMVAHTTPVWEDLGSILHTPQTQEGVYSEALISLLSDNRLKNNVKLLCQVEKNNIIYYIIAAEVNSKKWNCDNQNIREKIIWIILEQKPLEYCSSAYYTEIIYVGKFCPICSLCLLSIN